MGSRDSEFLSSLDSERSSSSPTTTRESGPTSPVVSPLVSTSRESPPASPGGGITESEAGAVSPLVSPLASPVESGAPGSFHLYPPSPSTSTSRGGGDFSSLQKNPKFVLSEYPSVAGGGLGERNTSGTASNRSPLSRWNNESREQRDVVNWRTTSRSLSKDLLPGQYQLHQFVAQHGQEPDPAPATSSTSNLLLSNINEVQSRTRTSARFSSASGFSSEEGDEATESEYVSSALFPGFDPAATEEDEPVSWRSAAPDENKHIDITGRLREKAFQRGTPTSSLYGGGGTINNMLQSNSALGGGGQPQESGGGLGPTRLAVTTSSASLSASQSASSSSSRGMSKSADAASSCSHDLDDASQQEPTLEAVQRARMRKRLFSTRPPLEPVDTTTPAGEGIRADPLSATPGFVGGSTVVASSSSSSGSSASSFRGQATSTSSIAPATITDQQGRLWAEQHRSGEHKARQFMANEFVRTRSSLRPLTMPRRSFSQVVVDNLNKAPSLALAPTLTTPWQNEVLAGVSSGVVQVVIWNPYDRALYLSSVHQRPFFTRENWIRSVSDFNRGLLPNLMQRVITYGMYFPLEQAWVRILLGCLDKGLEDASASTIGGWSKILLVAPLAGQLTGACSGLVTNYLSLIKYKQYQREVQRSLLSDLQRIMHTQGTLSRGLFATVCRDSVFGGVFTSLRVLWQNEEYQLGVNFVAASLATICSGPLNYARNLQYAGQQGDRRTIRSVMQELGQDARGGAAGLRALTLKLRIGWGSVRVGLGMASGNYFYRYFEEVFNGYLSW
ncbi:unnamed protein product [Amoebophrya sp. A25]|nr:unnamed protein product [Amoebophrya sp. A25]|eukprot:GSA25T00014819001.1